MQWSWGLDPHHDTVTGIPPERSSPTNIRIGTDQMGAEPDIIQATLNLFADMGVQPGATTLSPGLVLPVSSDRIDINRRHAHAILLSTSTACGCWKQSRRPKYLTDAS